MLFLFLRKKNMSNYKIKGFVSNLDVREFNKGVKSNFIINGLKCVSWSKTIAEHLKNGMEVEILEYSLKTETWEKDGKKYYLDNRVVVERLKLLGQYEESDFVGIGEKMSSQAVEKYNKIFKEKEEPLDWGYSKNDELPKEDEDEETWELDL